MKGKNWGKCRKCGKDDARIAKNIANLGEQHPAFGD